MADREVGPLTPSRRELLLSAAFAIWGLAIAIALAALWQKPAPPGQLPGLGTRLNFDAHGPFRWMLGMMVLPIVMPLLLRPLSRRLAEGKAWARNTVLIAPLIAIWFVLITRVLSWAIVPYAIVIAVCTLLRDGDLRFTKHDIVLVPVLLTLLVSLNDAVPALSIDRALVVAALLLFALRVAVALVPAPLPPAFAFVAAPLGLLLQTNFFARDQRYFGWHALVIVVVTPFILRFALRNLRRAIVILVFVTYPLSLAFYFNATSIQTAEGKPRVSIFEESHSLLPAGEYLRGERPYRDIIPTHGLIEDGLLDLLIMRTRGASIGITWKTRLAIGMLNAVVLYLLGWAVTGSPAAAFLAVLLGAMTNMHTPAFRLLPPLLALFFLCGAFRWRRVKWLRYAAIAAVFCGATSIDFGAYTFLSLVVAVLRWPDRLQALRAVAIGLAIAVVPLFGGFLVFGILDDFFRTTFFELLSLGPVYTLTMFAPPDTLPRAFPDALTGFFNRDAFLYLIWCAAVVFAGVMFTRRARRRFEPMVIIAFWMTLVAISYAERHHLYYSIVAPLFAAGAVMVAVRRRNMLAPAMILGLLILAAPTTHLAVMAWIRDARGPVEPEIWVEVPEIPRARGALFHREDAQALRGVAKYASLALAPNETWFDFSNRGIFYFFLRRDCPIRQPEVAFYETEARQREVIARLDANPRIRAVLLPGPTGRYTVDGVTNSERAPLVWQYIQQHFTPDFEEGDVVMWRRK